MSKNRKDNDFENNFYLGLCGRSFGPEICLTLLENSLELLDRLFQLEFDCQVLKLQRLLGIVVSKVADSGGRSENDKIIVIVTIYSGVKKTV